MAVSTLENKSASFAFGVCGGVITGVFGEGKTQIFIKSGDFKAPKKGFYRVRLWGAGGNRFYMSTNLYGFGGQGGFSMKTIELEKDQVVPVVVGANEGTTSSFGSYLSATGGGTTAKGNSSFIGSPGTGGRGVGGDININGYNGHQGAEPIAPYNLERGFTRVSFGLEPFEFSSIPTLDHICTDGQYPSGANYAGLVVVEY